MRPRPPQDVLGFGSTAADLKDLFPSDLCGPIAADLKQEDEQLDREVRRGRLEGWFTGVVDAAQRSVQDEVEAEVGMAQNQRTVERNLVTQTRTLSSKGSG